MTTDAAPQPQPVIQKTSGLAIASLVTGITCLSPLAIIFGHVSLSQIKKSGGTLGGGGLALAGTILGYVTLVLNLAFVIPVLFVGSTAWKKGADHSECVINIRNVQQAIRGHQNMNSIDEGAQINWDEIFGPNGYMLKPVCPTHGVYHEMDIYPPQGVTVFSCPGDDHRLEPENTEGW